MKNEMKNRILNQLKLVENVLYCEHNDKSACNECKKKIRGDVTGIHGDVTGIYGNVTGIRGDVSGIRGNVSGIRGDVNEFVEVLKEKQEGGR